MLRWTLLLVAWFWASTASAEVIIDKEYWTPNQAPGYCGWCSLRMAGLQQGIKKIDPIVKLREEILWDWTWLDGWWQPIPGCAATADVIASQLDKIGVRYVISTTKNDDGLIRQMIKDRGVSVGMRVWWSNSRSGQSEGWHMIVLTEYTDKKVAFKDPNDVQNVYWASREWFDYFWNGLAVVLEE